MTLRALALLALVACNSDNGSNNDDTGSNTGTDTAAGDTGAGDTGAVDSGKVTGQQYAVVTTVSSDSTTGSFATVSLDDWTV